MYGSQFNPFFSLALDRSMPMTRGMGLAVDFRDPLARCLVTGIRPRGTLLRDGQTNGACGRAEATSMGLTYGLASMHGVRSGDVTVFALYRFDTGGPVDHTLFSALDGVGTGWSLHSGSSSSTNWSINSSFVGGSSDSPNGTTDGWNVMCCRWNLGGSGNYTLNENLSTAVTGTLGTNLAASTVLVTLVSVNTNMTLGRGCSIAVIYAWNRLISDNEYYTLYADPRRPVRAMPRYILGGSAPAVTTPWFPMIAPSPVPATSQLIPF